MQLACSIFAKREEFEKDKCRIKQKEKRKILALVKKRRLVVAKMEDRLWKEKVKLQKNWQQDKAWGDDAGLSALKETCIGIIVTEMMLSECGEV